MAKNEICLVRSNSTFMASQEREEWGYTGGNPPCGHTNYCKGNLENCYWADQRTIYLRQEGVSELPTQTDKFIGKIERHFEIIGTPVEQ